jgi:hypothetical protein
MLRLPLAVIGGTGTVWFDVHIRLLFREGGGVLWEHSAVRIRHNVIEGNEAVAVREGVVSAGSGMRFFYVAGSVVRGNIVRGNRQVDGAEIARFHRRTGQRALAPAAELGENVTPATAT